MQACTNLATMYLSHNVYNGEWVYFQGKQLCYFSIVSLLSTPIEFVYLGANSYFEE